MKTKFGLFWFFLLFFGCFLSLIADGQGVPPMDYYTGTITIYNNTSLNVYFALLANGTQYAGNQGNIPPGQQVSGGFGTVRGSGFNDNYYPTALDMVGCVDSSGNNVYGGPYTCVAWDANGSFVQPDCFCSPLLINPPYVSGQGGYHSLGQVIISSFNTGGQTPTDTFSATVNNPSSQPQMYALVATNDGSYLALDPCGDNMTVVPAGGSAVLSGVSAATNGVQLMLLTGNVNSIAKGISVGPCNPNSYNISGSEGIQGALTGQNISGVPNGAGSFQSLTNSPGLLLGGTNDVSFPQLPTNLARDVTVQVGDNAIVQAIQNAAGQLTMGQNNLNASVASGDSAIVAAVNAGANLVSANNEYYATRGVTNIVNALSNTMSFPSNFPDFLAESNLSYISSELNGSNVLSIQSMLSNTVLPGISAGSNFAYGAAQSLGSTWSNSIGSRWAASPALGGGASSVNVPMPFDLEGNSLDVNMSVDGIPASGQAIINLASIVIQGLVLFIYFMKVLEVTKVEMGLVLAQRQMQGTSQSFLGTNVSMPTAMVYAAAMIALIATVPIIVLNYTTATNVADGIVDGWYAFTGLSYYGAFALMSAIMPISLLMSSFIGYYVFKFLLLTPSVLFMRTLVVFFFS